MELIYQENYLEEEEKHLRTNMQMIFQDPYGMFKPS